MSMEEMQVVSNTKQAPVKVNLSSNVFLRFCMRLKQYNKVPAKQTFSLSVALAFMVSDGQT